ncbi:MAG: flagellar protein FliT [Aromatoleum sp.]|jgi:flagellar protein FliT|uniref:flagellar protein FliT n=1 Tax=Aromatoleum sp. TaxID=2307007 RepID=UPI002895C76C|nr:flagellar protein FliT [Aromatoleum sp.]MDT3668879.1 flagellar protein FliT [Aromatoleum sp.]
MNALSLFESMATTSANMLGAARANDWDRLATLEREVAALRDELMRIEPNGRQSEALGEGEQLRKAALVAQMLDNDREIRRHVEPWLASTRKLLSGSSRERAVRAAYGP